MGGVRPGCAAEQVGDPDERVLHAGHAQAGVGAGGRLPPLRGIPPERCVCVAPIPRPAWLRGAPLCLSLTLTLYS